MFYAISAILAEGAESKIESMVGDFNEHLSQPFRRVRLAGPLCDPEGRKKGYLVVIEADSIKDAETYLHESPIFRAGLYERAELFEYQIQIGTLG
jgi:uncharacterized protein YciI